MLIIATHDPQALLRDWPALARRLATADHHHEDFLALEDWLLSVHSVPAEAEPALAAGRLDTEGRGHGWLRIDALSLVISRDRLVALPQGPDDAEDAAVLIDAVLTHLPTLGTIHSSGMQRLLDLDAPAEARFAPAWRTAGRPLDSHLPEGPRGAEWRRWLTEAQMLLHEHPLNQQREARGLRPLNALWLSGGSANAPTPRDAGVRLLGAHPLAAVLPLATDASSLGKAGSRPTNTGAHLGQPLQSQRHDADILVWPQRFGEPPPPEAAATLARATFALRILAHSGQQCYTRRLWHGLRVWRKPLRSLPPDSP